MTIITEVCGPSPVWQFHSLPLHEQLRAEEATASFAINRGLFEVQLQLCLDDDFGSETTAEISFKDVNNKPFNRQSILNPLLSITR